MLEENPIVPHDDEEFAEELLLDFEGGHDPEAVWEWDGEAWIAIAG